MVNATPRPLHPWERPGTHCIGGWVGPRARLDGCGKSRPPPGFDPRTVQPVASRYADWAIPVHILYRVRAQKTITEAMPAIKTWKLYRPTFALRCVMSGFQIPIGQEIFLSSRKRSDQVWVPPTLLLNRYRDYFAGVKLTTHLHLASRLTLNTLMWKIWWAPNNVSRWQMGFNSAFKGSRMSGAIPLLNL